MQFVYLLLSLYYGRKNTLFYMIFPIAMVAGYGALIDPRTVFFGIDIFTFSKNIYKDIVILYLACIAFHLRRRIRIPVSKTKPFIALSIYIFFLILYTILKHGFEYEALNVMRLFTHMILGFYLTLAIFSTANQTKVITFFNSLFYANGALSILYVLNSSQIFTIFYKETLYQEVEYGADTFYRDFSTIPYFSHLLFILAFSSTITRSRIFERKAMYTSLSSYPFVLLFTFTRNLLGIVIIEIIVILIIIAIKDPKKLFHKTTLFIFTGSTLIYLLIQIFFNSQYNYFNSRIETAKTEGKDENNFAVRIAYHVEAYNILERKEALILGDGINKKNDHNMLKIGAWAADSTIPFWLIYTGILGVVLFYYTSIYFWYISLKNLFSNFNPFSITFFTVITLSTFLSLIIGGYRWGDPLIFINYTLVVFTTIKDKPKKLRLHTW